MNGRGFQPDQDELDELIRLAQNNPILHYAMMHYTNGLCSYKEAVIAAFKASVEQNTELMKHVVNQALVAPTTMVLKIKPRLAAKHINLNFDVLENEHGHQTKTPRAEAEAPRENPAATPGP
jgi:hypothetical protein